MLLQTGRKESSLIKTATETGLIWGMQPGREAGPASGGGQGDLNKGSVRKNRVQVGVNVRGKFWHLDQRSQTDVLVMAEKKGIALVSSARALCKLAPHLQRQPGGSLGSWRPRMVRLLPAVRLETMRM